MNEEKMEIDQCVFCHHNMVKLEQRMGEFETFWCPECGSVTTMEKAFGFSIKRKPKLVDLIGDKS